MAFPAVAVVTGLALPEVYALFKVYWLEDPEAFLNQVHIILREVNDGLQRMSMLQVTRMVERNVSEKMMSSSEFEFVKALRDEHKDCGKLYTRFKHDLKKHYPKKWQLLLYGSQLYKDIKDLRKKVADLELDYLKTSSALEFSDYEDSDDEDTDK
ncbi:uncharacterized protein PHACADRAFT_201574 [Phanerochaete carnosa HHB-10118-sp]|uniref:Uncharacterized protein n=1 Tax=Phanerochaete carnosa (strain HHB-10118-sp) TaxID=650164 RepID=K5VTI7_PHACS|nr:uncharacterized protein PHACADRAFT_201574 [Phanerochaete carnosa HHB-10118-sp]EKM49869.1 hypothetical protein PHACADRAFT_201574 [Phanerochaete carnosa HHB-10118-sp]